MIWYVFLILLQNYPFYEGAQYIKAYTHARGQSATDCVDTIDDPRNGIFLNSVAHKCLGRQFAILVVSSLA